MIFYNSVQGLVLLLNPLSKVSTNTSSVSSMGHLNLRVSGVLLKDRPFRVKQTASIIAALGSIYATQYREFLHQDNGPPKAAQGKAVEHTSRLQHRVIEVLLVNLKLLRLSRPS